MSKYMSHLSQLCSRLLVLVAVPMSLLVAPTDAMAACTLVITNAFGTNSSTGPYALSASGTSNGGFAPSTPISLTVLPSSGCPVWTAVSSDTTFLNIVSGASGGGFATLTFNAFANAHPSERTATITVTAGPSVATYAVSQSGSMDPLSNRQVRALYQRILGREPDPAGFAFWLGIASANPNGLGMMADNFLTSTEAVNTDFLTLALYQSVLGTRAGVLTPVTYADWNTSVNAFRAAGAVDAGGLTPAGIGAAVALVDRLIKSDAFTAELASVTVPTCPTGPSVTASQITALYRNVLGVPPSCAQLSSYSGVYKQGINTVTYNSSLAVVVIVFNGGAIVDIPVAWPQSGLVKLLKNPALQNYTTNPLFIDLLYFTILGRDPDPGGFNFWSNFANSGGPGVYFLPSGGTPAAIRTAIEGSGAPNEGFVGSPEFLNLFK